MRAPLYIAVLALIPCTASAQAGQVFTLPKGCTGYMTVQYRGCAVDLNYTCEAAQGQNLVLSVASDDTTTFRRYDREFRGLETRYFDDGMQIILQEPEPDPLSLTELLETGVDSYEYSDLVNGEFELTYKGVDTLANTQVTIDGRALEMTEFTMVMSGPDGEVLEQLSGQQFIDLEHRLFFPGIFVDELTGENTTNNTPAAFVYPGEPGFASRVPEFDCDANA